MAGKGLQHWRFAVGGSRRKGDTRAGNGGVVLIRDTAGQHNCSHRGLQAKPAQADDKAAPHQWLPLDRYPGY